MVEFGREEARHAAAFDVIRDIHMKKVKSRNRETCTLAENLLSTHFPVAHRRYM